MQTTPDSRPVTPEEIDGSFVPRPVVTLDRVPIGDEVVLLEGWMRATVLNATGALIWDRFDGSAPLGSLGGQLSDATGADPDLVLADVIAFTRHVAAQGLLVGAGPSPTDQQVHIEPIPDLQVGDLVADTDFLDLSGRSHTLADHRGRQVLLVNWSPHCGHCSAIAEHLAVLSGPLAEVGVELLLVSAASAEANRDVVEAAGLEVPVLLRQLEVDPFIGYGTPVAYHLDPEGRLAAPMASGSDQVVSLASGLAGVDPVTLMTDEWSDPVPAGTRYLLGDDRVCAPVRGDEPETTWSGIAEYRIDGFHVGLRHDSPATVDVLDGLFGDRRVRDRRAGHSYSVALVTEEETTGTARTDAAGSDASRRSLNLLVRAGRPLVRSRSAARILRALLWRLTDEIVGYDTEPGRIRVDAVASIVGGRAILLPAGLRALPSIQARLARNGIAVADVAFPEIDLETAELVVPQPGVSHDPAVIEALDHPITSSSELAAPGPGRYRLTGWGVTRPSDRRVSRLSPAEAAAATLSQMYEADDAVTRLRELGELFTRIEGFGLWYHSEAELVDAIVEAAS